MNPELIFPEKIVQVSLARLDGLHLQTKATLQQLADDDLVSVFGGGVITKALAQLTPTDFADWTLADTLHHTGPEVYGLITTLLILDAEVSSVIEGETRTFPLPGFLSYRPQLSPVKFPLNILRLPPLNPDGHYIYTAQNKHHTAVRLDIHPKLNVAGHVRIAVSSATRPPQRLLAAEHRLDRQKLTELLIEAAIIAASDDLSPPLTDAEQSNLVSALNALRTE